MRAFIYAGGQIEPRAVIARPGKDDLILCADSGLRNALLMNETPSFFIGDCDSFPEHQIPPGIEKILLKPEKDMTDTQFCVDFALSKGADDIQIIGGLDGRLDHTLSNLAILEKLWGLHVPALIEDGRNRVRFLSDSSTLIPKTAYTYLGLLTLDKKATGVDIEGCKYPLHKAKIMRHTQFAVSNEITGNCALISVRKGALYIVESTDARKES